MSEIDPTQAIRELLEEEPKAEQILKDIQDLNRMIREGEIDPEEDIDDIKELVQTFDEEWPYFEQEIVFTGQIKFVPVSQHAEIQVAPGTIGAVDGGAGICGGFALYNDDSEEPNYRVVHILNFDLNESQVVLPEGPKYDYLGIAEVGDVFMQHYKESEYDALDYMKHYLPDVAEEIDSRVLNCDDEVEAIEELKGFEMHHGVVENVGQHKEMTAQYMNEVIAFEQIVPYSAAIRGVVHIVDENGAIGVMQKINFNWQHVLLVPDKIVMIPKYVFGQGSEPRFSYETSVPALVAEAFEFEANKHTGGGIDVVIPITDELIVKSNLDMLPQVVTPGE